MSFSCIYFGESQFIYSLCIFLYYTKFLLGSLTVAKYFPIHKLTMNLLLSFVLQIFQVMYLLRLSIYGVL